MKWKTLTVLECKSLGIMPEDIRQASLHETPIGHNTKHGFMLKCSPTHTRPVVFKIWNGKKQ